MKKKKRKILNKFFYTSPDVECPDPNEETIIKDYEEESKICNQESSSLNTKKNI